MADILYTRVLPRDLFNEAKLLKCIGQLCLKIHDRMAPDKITYDENGYSFDIGLLPEGSLTIVNLPFHVWGHRVTFKTTYNSKSNYPLHAEHDNEEVLVFDEYGEFTGDFLQFVEVLKNLKYGNG